MVIRLLFLILLGQTLLGAAPALAGSSQAGGERFFEAERIIAFSKKVEKSLAANKARVAIIARVGRSRGDLPRGISFTHAGIAVYSKITTKDGRMLSGYSVYNLYQRSDKPDQSHLIQDYPVDFFAGVQVLEAGIIVPEPRLQSALLGVLTSDTYGKLHNPKYSAIANPFTPELQNCTEFLLDLLFVAIYRTEDIRQIKANEKAYFKAQVLDVSPLKLMLGSLFAADITTADHPGTPETATFTTIGNFLEEFGLVSRRYILSEDL